MKASTKDIKDSPIAWFYTLEDARRRNDFERAAEAKKQLERLGVFVRFKGKVQRQCKQAEQKLIAHRRTLLGAENA